ncbi:protein Gemin2 [Anopheles darlingi]|uniref:protein Gemin2 n=1 Tax=Anopheles darlingi TaxID=43151 RepID=UPI0021003378|nr:protein Gemin2 [Anopheles darlingi]
MEIDLIQKPALAVDPPDESFDPNQEPETGEQYLQKVMYERNRCPMVVVAANPHTDQQKSLSGTAALPANSVTNSAHQTLIPTKEWESMQNQKFTELRDTITSYRCSSQFQENLQRTHVFLNFEDRKQLHEYCANNQPYVRILLSIPQRNLETLLEYLYEWLQDSDPAGESDQSATSQQEEQTSDQDMIGDVTTTPVTSSVSKQPAQRCLRKDWITQWIYAIMACLITPLEPYIHSVLRDIAKTCIMLRNELNREDEAKVLPLNLLISIISQNFNQLDLADNID